MSRRPHETGDDPRDRSIFDDGRTVGRIFYGLCAACGLSVAADFFYHRHGHYEIEALFGAYGIFGFISCVGLVLAAKELRKLLMRDEDYYNDGE